MTILEIIAISFGWGMLGGLVAFLLISGIEKARKARSGEGENGATIDA